MLAESVKKAAKKTDFVGMLGLTGPIITLSSVATLPYGPLEGNTTVEWADEPRSRLGSRVWGGRPRLIQGEQAYAPGIVWGNCLSDGFSDRAEHVNRTRPVRVYRLFGARGAVGETTHTDG